MSRARVALVAALAAGPVLPASGTTECVRVVVDYGTFAGAPAGPNTTCVVPRSPGRAAEALAARADARDAPPPRYTSSGFLCAIDGYPESGCGDHGTEPYWSFWIWRDGAWDYASEGVTHTVSDTDGDGHPDPLGFRYHAFEKKERPRAAPAYPKPSAPPTTTAPARTPAATRGPSNDPTNGPASGLPGGEPATRAPGHSPTAAARATGTPSGSAAVAAAATSPAQPVPSGTAAPPPETREPTAPRRAVGGGVPAGTVLGGLLALGLLGAAAWRFRKPAA